MNRSARQRQTGTSNAVRVCAALAAPLLSSLAHAGPEAGASRRSGPAWYESDSWRQPEGLPQDSIFNIAQTRDGYLWLGTRSGLARFDGVHFTTYDDRSKEALRDNEVWALLEADGGGLWVGTHGGGLGRVQDGHIRFLTTKDGLVSDFVRALAKDAQGVLWVGTDSGLSRLENGRFTSFTSASGLGYEGVRSLWADPDGSIFVATKDGLETVKDGRALPVVLPEPRPTGLIDDLRRDRHGVLWIATQDGLFRWAGDTLTRYTTANGLSSNRVRLVFEDEPGRLWIATNVGLDRFVGAPQAARPIVNVGPMSDIRSLGADREGGLWVGYEGYGLARLHEGLFASYTAADGLPSSDVRSVLDDRAGNKWIGTAKGLGFLPAVTNTTFRSVTGVPSVPIDALMQDRAGTVWIGSELGLYRSTEPEPCRVPVQPCVPSFAAVPNPDIPQMHVRVIFEDRTGAVWAGTNLEGLTRYRDGRFTTYTVKDGLSNAGVRAMVEDDDGVLWIGTKGGLDRFEGGRFTKSYTHKDGLPSDGLSALHRDASGALWIATRYGLARLKDGRVTSCTTKDGLFAGHVYGFVEDGNGNLWMNCARGIFRVNKRQLDDFTDGKLPGVVSVAYGHEHGLLSGMTAVATHPTSARGRDGRLWFATRGGLAVVDPQALTPNAVVPPVHLEQVEIDGRPLDLGSAAVAGPGRGDLVFRYTAPSFKAPEKVKFRYRLEGFDHDWVEADTRRVAYYTNIPPGAYRFRVVACNNDGRWNEAGAAFELRLRPHFYQTYWFYGLGALALALVGAATQRLRVRRLQEQARSLSVRVEDAVAQIKVLRGLLPVCATCKKIRDDRGYWNDMEAYITEHSEADFTHGICPDCAEELYPGYAQKRRELEATRRR